MYIIFILESMHLCFVHRRGKCWGPPADPKWLLRFQHHFWQKISCWNFVQGWLLLVGFQIYDSIRFQIFSCPIPRRLPWTPFTAALLSIALLFCIFRPEVPVRRIDFSSKFSHSSYCSWSFVIYICIYRLESFRINFPCCASGCTFWLCVVIRFSWAVAAAQVGLPSPALEKLLSRQQELLQGPERRPPWELKRFQLFA